MVISNLNTTLWCPEDLSVDNDMTDLDKFDKLQLRITTGNIAGMAIVPLRKNESENVCKNSEHNLFDFSLYKWYIEKKIFVLTIVSYF